MNQLLTVFTPVYNRGYIIGQLYASLCEQTCRNFEWIVVDDGSSDNIDELMDGFIKEGKIKIRYFKQKNQGKHVAINTGVSHADSPLFFIVDSDDSLTPDAVEWIAENSVPLLDNPAYAGLSGIRITPDGRKIGGGPDFGRIDVYAPQIRDKFKITGDLAEIYKTDVLRQYPFPVFDNEKFCPEALVWNRIARKFKMRLIHKGIYVCEYLPDGLTARITRLRRESPRASMTYYAEHFRNNISLKSRIKAAINFWRFSLNPYRREYRMLNPISILCYLPGKFMAWNDSRSVKK